MEEGKFSNPKLPSLKTHLSERRRFPRFGCEFPIDCITRETETHVGIAANISQEGILICLHDRITVGTPLRVQLVFAQGFKLKAINANAIVVWTDIVQHAFWGRYRYGLRLIKMTEGVFSDFKRLLGHLAWESHSKNSFPIS
jgi:hypothetical protein